MKKTLVEFIGTFFLVLTVGLSVRSGAALAPVAIGAVLMVMVYSGGHISGGHYNPAVTLAALTRGKITLAESIPYWISQLAAGAVAAFLANFLLGGSVAAPATHALVPSVIVEFLYTFALAWVVLNSATAKGTAGNSFYGLAIGFTVLVGAVTVGGISGGAFNPAVGLGVYLQGLESVQQFGVYAVSDLAGGLAAGLAFNALSE